MTRSKRLHRATEQTLTDWTERLRKDAADAFPEKVTAFREEMAVHGRYQKPCPVCGTKVQRVRYADNELNYCPRCQTGGKLLADRSLSRLLRGDWPRSIDELEQLAERKRPSGRARSARAGGQAAAAEGFAAVRPIAAASCGAANRVCTAHSGSRPTHSRARRGARCGSH